MLSEQAIFIARSFLIFFKRLCQYQEAPLVWKTANITPIFKKCKKENPKNSRPSSLTLIPKKVMEQLIWDTISRHMKDNKMNRSRQQRRNINNFVQ